MFNRRLKMKFLYILILPLLFSSLTTFSQSIKLSNGIPDEIYSSGFTLTSDSELKIQAKVLTDKFTVGDYQYDFSGNLWIISAETGALIWTPKRTTFSDIKNLSNLDTIIQLPKGNYEVYLSTYLIMVYNVEKTDRNLGGKWDKLMDKMFNFKDMVRIQVPKQLPDVKEWFVEIKSSNLKPEAVASVRNFNNEFIAIKDATVNSAYRKPFMVTKSVKLRIIGQGEGNNFSMSDYGQIKNLNTRETIWKMTFDNTSEAGGSPKNRRVDEALTLDPGDYELRYFTDDSHNYGNWNTAPPYDPQFWGVAIILIDQNSKQYIKDLTEVEQPVVINFSKVGDSQVLKQTFRVKKDVKLNIYALGEVSYSRKMADYGWIEDLDTHERVWEMSYWNSEHAGGSTKNRVSDEIITIKPGTYLACYVTDDSHAYNDWNDAKPYSPADWGMKISYVGTEDLNKYLELFNGNENDKMLADLTPLGNYADAKKEFKLNKPTRVNIIAIGEGDSDGMYDYGWIENKETGDIIWEMTYKKTQNAGGASKNRKVDQTIMLDKGTYIVHFKTDGSHSFPNWNSSPPDDPINWGIRVLKNEGNK